MQGSNHPRRLAVEGFEDLYSVVGIMRAYIDWPERVEEAPVWIEQVGSADEILDSTYLDVLLRSVPVKMAGIMIDANSNADSRYRRICNKCNSRFPRMPDKLPQDGLVVENEQGKRLGVWIMPNNASNGALENFLIELIPGPAKPLFKYARESVAGAREFDAPFRDAHSEKAQLYTWLAMQDPPSQNPRNALYSKALDPGLPAAQKFSKWFRRLYNL